MLKKIYQELVLIRKELQAIRSSKEFQGITLLMVKLFPIWEVIVHSFHSGFV